MGITLTIGTICIAALTQGVDRPLRAPSESERTEQTLQSTYASAGTPVEAGNRSGERIEQLVDSLLDWVAAHSTYDVAPMHDVPPAVIFIEAGDKFECEGEDVIVEDGVHAVYDHSTRQIRIVLPWDILKSYDQSILLHEIVHDVQLNSRYWFCPAETEWEAYQLQDEWLKEHDSVSGFDWLHVYFLSRCPRDFHP